MYISGIFGIFITLISITLQSPFSQYHHSSNNQQYSPFVRHPYGLERNYDNHDLDRAESHHNSRRNHQPISHQPISHHSVSHHSESRHDIQPLDETQRNKRQTFLPYFPYHLPYQLPPFYQVHNIYLTPPGYNCYPSRPSFPERPPSKRPDETIPEPDDGLGNRFGDSKNGTETPKNPQPSKCVWSIVACCSPGSRDIRYACFELLGCPGAFWDVNPCDEKVVTAAANSALRFYMNNQSPTPEPTFQNL